MFNVTMTIISQNLTHKMVMWARCLLCDRLETTGDNCTLYHRRSVAVPVVYSGGHAPLLKSPPDNCYASILPLLFTTTASKYHILLPVMQSHYSITFLKTDS